MIIYLNSHYVHACMCFKLQIFVTNGKSRIKCFEKYDVSTKGASQKFLDNPQPLMKYKFS